MHTGEIKKVRAVSARPNRPLSGTARRSQKTQFIENLYGGTVVNRKGFSEHYAVKQDQEKFKKLLPNKAPKEYEQFFEENMHLKSTINKLNEQISLQRGQIQVLEKKNHKFSKQTKMEFQKQLYWTGSNSHMITGIKSHYDLLKSRYDEKCKECEDLKRNIKYSQVTEYRIYSQNLEKQNTRLKQKLQVLLINDSEQLIQKNTKQISEYILKQLQLKNIRLQQKNIELQGQLKASNTSITDLNKKIQFLQKLIIQKDNAQYHASRKAKKTEKQKLAVEVELQETKNEKEQLKQNYEQKIVNLKNKELKKYNIEKNMFEKTLNQQERKIEKLEKQVAYLSTLLTYWKPLDEINKEVADKIINQDKNVTQRNVLMSSVKDPLINQRKLSMSVHKNASAFDELNINASLANTFQNILSKPKPKRIPQSASEKYSQTAQKKRKVSKDEVQQIGQLLRFRFIAQNISIQEVKQYFTYKKDKKQQNKQESDNQQSIQQFEQDQQSEQKWREKYITMKEVIYVLKSAIFNLSQDFAFLLSRYLIQECQNQFVYCDQNNENLRSIIKSIIKTIVGEYQILTKEQKQGVEIQCSSILKMYQSNLLPALKTVASSGFVINHKFLQLIYSLGIQLTNRAKEHLVAKMAMESESLNKLNYKILW